MIFVVTTVIEFYPPLPERSCMLQQSLEFFVLRNIRDLFMSGNTSCEHAMHCALKGRFFAFDVSDVGATTQRILFQKKNELC